ncbi:hypothetical protein AB3N59_02080 [Leptospira sp. WS92.C1]
MNLSPRWIRFALYAVPLVFLFSFQNLFSQNLVPVSAQNSEREEQESSNPGSIKEEKSFSQKDIRMKKKFLLGGIYFKGYGSVIVGWNAWQKVTIGVQYYQNSYRINGDFDSGYSYMINYGVARQSDRELKAAGGGFFLNYFLADSSVYIPILVGAEFMRNTRYDQFVDTKGPQSYRSERIHLDYGPRYYAGTGLGVRHQFESGFFFGFEVVMRTFAPYHKNVTIDNLEFTDHQADVIDYWLRKEEIKRDRAGKVSDAGFDLSVGVVF